MELLVAGRSDFDDDRVSTTRLTNVPLLAKKNGITIKGRDGWTRA